MSRRNTSSISRRYRTAEGEAIPILETSNITPTNDNSTPELQDNELGLPPAETQNQTVAGNPESNRSLYWLRRWYNNGGFYFSESEDEFLDQLIENADVNNIPLEPDDYINTQERRNRIRRSRIAIVNSNTRNRRNRNHRNRIAIVNSRNRRHHPRPNPRNNSNTHSSSENNRNSDGRHRPCPNARNSNTYGINERNHNRPCPYARRNLNAHRISDNNRNSHNYRNRDRRHHPYGHANRNSNGHSNNDNNQNEAGLQNFNVYDTINNFNSALLCMREALRNFNRILEQQNRRSTNH